MSFKWVQCQQCFTTKHVDGFPETDQKSCKRLGYGICKRCLGAGGMRFKSPLEVFGAEFYEFMGGFTS